MHDFRCTTDKDMHCAKLTEKVKYFKETEGSSNAMRKMMEDMRYEVAKNTTRS